MTQNTYIFKNRIEYSEIFENEYTAKYIAIQVITANLGVKSVQVCDYITGEIIDEY